MPPAKKPSRPVDVYVRVSRVGGREGDSYQSPEEQRTRCLGYLAAHGFAAGEVITDEDQSGGKMNRPGFDRVMERIRSGASGGVVVAKLNRFARNTVGTITTITEIEDAGAVFLSIDPSVDTTTSSGKFMLTVFAALAQMELEQIQATWKVSITNAKRRGVFITARVPFGYEKPGRGQPLIQHEEHAALVAEVYAMRGQGATFGECAEMLNEAGTVTSAFEREGEGAKRGGNPWTESATRKMVANPIYCGRPKGGDEMPEDARGALRIVSRRVWEKAQPAKGTRKARSPEGTLLQGILRCGVCGGMLTPQPTKKTRVDGTKIYTVQYRCRQRAVDAPTCSHPLTISGPVIEPLIAERMIDLLAQRGTSQSMVVDADLDRAQEILADAQHDLQELEDLRGTIKPAAYAVALGDAQDAVEAAAAEVDRLAGRRGDARPMTRESAEALWGRMNTASRREMIRAFIKSITVRHAASRVEPIHERITSVEFAFDTGRNG